MSKKKSRDDRKPSAEVGEASPRYVPAPGARISKSDAVVIGEALAAIAEQNAVGDVRTLDKHLVYDAVSQDEDHPLRPYVFTEDDDEAARLHRVEKCGLLIRSVHYVVSEADKERPQIRVPMFVAVDSIRRKDFSSIHRRRRAMLEDVVLDDPAFASALMGQARLVISAVERFEKLVAMRGSGRSATRFARDLRVAIDSYLQPQLDIVAAAEE